MINHITIEGRTLDSTLEFERTPGDDIAYQKALLEYFRDEEKIPLSKIAKYYLNENLNFLCGSGTSVAIGGSASASTSGSTSSNASSIIKPSFK